METMFHKEDGIRQSTYQFKNFDVRGYHDDLTLTIECSAVNFCNTLVNCLTEHGINSVVEDNRITVKEVTVLPDKDSSGCLRLYQYKNTGEGITNYIKGYKGGWHLEVIKSKEVYMASYFPNELNNPKFIEPGIIFNVPAPSAL